MQERMQYALNYSGTRFLSTENQIAQCPGGFRPNSLAILRKTLKHARQNARANSYLGPSRTL